MVGKTSSKHGNAVFKRLSAGVPAYPYKLKKRDLLKDVCTPLPFFEETAFQRKGAEPIAAFCTAMEFSKARLEAIDQETKISKNEL